MTSEQPRNPLHGITLATMLEQLVAHFGWNELGHIITIRCFTHEPSIKSSLAFLRKTPWARTKVEKLYLDARYDFSGEKPAEDSAEKPPSPWSNYRGTQDSETQDN
ncbi:MAG: VF530 family protein [Planctomycetota bacterium]